MERLATNTPVQVKKPSYSFVAFAVPAITVILTILSMDIKQNMQSSKLKCKCKAYKRVGEDMMIIFGDDKDTARQDILSRIRFYAYPYAVYKSSNSSERGFLFVQSDSSLAVMSLPGTILSNGRQYSKQRSVLLHWLTMKEYDSEVCMDDFELAAVRKELKVAVEEYDDKVEVPVLMRFRCGHVAVGIAPLVPDYKLCTVLGKEYYGTGQGSGALQLNIDDM